MDSTHFASADFGKVPPSLTPDRPERLLHADALHGAPTWAWHQHSNTSANEPALYVACENAPMLQNLGIALREEA